MSEFDAILNPDTGRPAGEDVDNIDRAEDQPDQLVGRDGLFAQFAWQTTSCTTDLDQTIATVVSFARHSLTADTATITLIRPACLLISLGATDLAARQADNLQHQLGEGPCLQASLDHQPDHRPGQRLGYQSVAAADIGADPRWPAWGPQAANLGLRSILSVSLRTATGQRLGSLNLYGYSFRRHTRADHETAHLFAAHATAAIAAAIQTDKLQQALTSRTIIGQAQGVLIARYRLTAETAIDALRRYSQDTNTKLHTLAHEIVQTGNLPAKYLTAQGSK